MSTKKVRFQDHSPSPSISSSVPSSEKPQAPQISGTKAPQPKRCWNCWDEGHKSSHCPKPSLPVHLRENLRIELQIPSPGIAYENFLKMNSCWNCWTSCDHPPIDCPDRQRTTFQREYLRAQLGMPLTNAWRQELKRTKTPIIDSILQIVDQVELEELSEAESGSTETITVKASSDESSQGSSDGASVTTSITPQLVQHSDTLSKSSSVAPQLVDSGFDPGTSNDHHGDNFGNGGHDKTIMFSKDKQGDHEGDEEEAPKLVASKKQKVASVSRKLGINALIVPTAGGADAIFEGVVDQHDAFIATLLGAEYYAPKVNASDDEIEHSFSTYQGQFENLKREYIDLQTMKKISDEALAKVTSRCKYLESSIDSLKSALMAKCNELFEEKNKLKRENTQLKDEIAPLRAENASLREKLEGPDPYKAVEMCKNFQKIMAEGAKVNAEMDLASFTEESKGSTGQKENGIVQANSSHVAMFNAVVQASTSGGKKFYGWYDPTKVDDAWEAVEPSPEELQAKADHQAKPVVSKREGGEASYEVSWDKHPQYGVSQLDLESARKQQEDYAAGRTKKYLPGPVGYGISDKPQASKPQRQTIQYGNPVKKEVQQGQYTKKYSGLEKSFMPANQAPPKLTKAQDRQSESLPPPHLRISEEHKRKIERQDRQHAEGVTHQKYSNNFFTGQGQSSAKSSEETNPHQGPDGKTGVHEFQNRVYTTREYLDPETGRTKQVITSTRMK